MRRAFNLLRNLMRQGRYEQELDAELRATLDLLVDEQRTRGVDASAAAVRARQQLGSLAAIKDRVNDVKAGALLDAFLNDVRYGARLLRRNPVFAITAALSLAIGIGAATAIVTVANALLLTAAPGLPEPDRLVDISKLQRGVPLSNPSVSYRTYLDLRERMTTVDLFVQQPGPEPITLSTGGETMRAFATWVSPNYFEMLGLSPAAGRLFNASDGDERSARPLAVLSHAFWLRQFHGDPAIVGGNTLVDGESFVVIGVAPQGFWGTSVVSADMWLPVGAKYMDRSFLTVRGADWGIVGGRLRTGVSRTAASAELDAVAGALERAYPDEYGGQGYLLARASPIPPGLRFVVAGFLALLLGLVSLVLVIACANVSGVLLARAAARRREMAVRAAIGAGRARLIRQLLTETMLLFVLGGAAGVALARGMTTLVLKLLPAFPVPIALSFPIDARVLMFAAAVSFVAAVLCGLAPALHVARADVVGGLKADAQGPDRLRLRNAFVVVQVAFSILLIVAAGILGRALLRVADPVEGIDGRNIVAASLDLVKMGYTETTGPRFVRELTDRLRTVPGVEAVTLADQIPLQSMVIGPLLVPGVPPSDGRDFFRANWTIVDVGYFETMRVPLVSGRDFTTSDFAGTTPVAIVAEATARHLWPGEEALGRFIQWPPIDPNGVETTFQVIGVARDTGSSNRMLRERRGGAGSDAALPPPLPPAVVYVPLLQRYNPQLALLVRMADGEPADRVMAAIGPIGVDEPRPLFENLERKGDSPVQLQLRIAGSVAAALGVVGLLLAAIGIYGVTAYVMVQRTREIGIRLAMGARGSDIMAMMLRRGMTLVAIGLAIGLLLSAAGSRVLRGLLFGAPPIDPLVYGAATALFIAVGAVACYLPTRRAARIEAIEALRCE